MVQGVYQYYLVGRNYEGKALAKLGGSSSKRHLPADDKPMPFAIEYNEADGDDIKALAPYVEALRALDTEFADGTIDHKTLVDKVVAVLGSEVNLVWPHRKAVYALLDSESGGRRIIAMRYSTVKPYVKGDPTPYFVMYKFCSLVHAIIWMIAGGNANLMTWNHLRWIGVKETRRKTPARSTTRSASPDEILVVSDGDSGSVMEVDDRDNHEPGSSINGFLPAPHRAPVLTLPAQRGSGQSASTSRTLTPAPSRSGTPASPDDPQLKGRNFVTHPLRASSIVPGPDSPFISPVIMKQLKPSAVYAVKHHQVPPFPTLNLELVKVSDTDKVARIQQSNPYISVELPDFLVFYLHCHGWTHSQRILTTIETAVKLKTKHEPLVVLLANTGMPALQAEYLATLLHDWYTD